MLANVGLIQSSAWKNTPRKFVLLGEFIGRERNTSLIPQMQALDNPSPKFIIKPENDYTQ